MAWQGGWECNEPVMGEPAIRCNVLTKGKRLQDITIMVGGGLEFKQYNAMINKSDPNQNNKRAGK